MGRELPILFAARLGQIGRVVLGQYHDGLLRPVDQHIGDVGGKRRVAALVVGHQHAVDPHAGMVVDRAEMQHRARRPLGQLETAPIPASEMEGLVVDSARGGLRRERHVDAMRPLDAVAGHAMPAVAAEGEFPLPVQRLPLVAHQLWAWILKQTLS
jgi:hypothetical protein